jgi:hypothetical protein
VLAARYLLAPARSVHLTCAQPASQDRANVSIRPFSRSCSVTADQRLCPRLVPRNQVTVVALLELSDLRGHLYGTRFDLVAGRHPAAGYPALVPAWRSIAAQPAHNRTTRRWDSA